MRQLVLFVMLIAPASAGADQKPKPPLIPIFVTTAALDEEAAKGFTSAPPPDVITLRRKIDQHRRGIKGDVFTLATTREAAAIRFEYGGTTKQQVAGSHLVSWSATKNDYTVRGTLVVGDLRKEFTATNDDLDVALSKLATAIETFVRDNRDKIPH